jgi:hypothetical protein
MNGNQDWINKIASASLHETHQHNSNVNRSVHSIMPSSSNALISYNNNRYDS